ncbi:MAG: sulfurtransferase [Sulfurimonas sp.]|nr:MAG: sulfurtransferase [Sulfurimonas sp.]
MKTNFITIALVTVLSLSASLFAKDEAFFTMLKEAKKVAGEIKAQDLMKKIDDDDDVIILDVREKEQRTEGFLFVEEDTPLNIYHITRGNLEFYINDKIKDKNAFIVTYCRSGGRGAMAAKTLRELGYKNATNLQGGLKGWANAGYPVKTGFGITKISKD